MASIIRTLNAVDAAAGIFNYLISGDPTLSVGLPAPIGATATRYDGGGVTSGEGARYVKTGAGNTAWTLIASGAP